MRISLHFRRSLLQLTSHVLCAVLLIGTLAPAAYAGGGKKYFKEGMKYEISKEWDRAAEQFSLALREDPGNPEYELHYVKAIQSASLMFMSRGRLLAEAQDYEGAYLAYKQAASFDPTNEQAVKRMKDMLYKQGIPSTDKGDPDTTFQATGAKVKPTAELAKPKRVLRSYDLPNESVENIIRLIARQDLRFNVIFDQQSRSVVQSKQRFDLKDIPPADALEILLDANNLAYFPVGYRTLMIGPRNNPTLQQKYDENLVQTFYIKNAKL
ncbi:MAG: hypothetical protein K1Y36_03565, partial [Blastocatellia bacterium]|nr:hypothetical protein [Blastocatellia bacterium]